MKKKLYNIICILYLLLTSCEEIYRPSLDNTENILVVEGLITNENKSHKIYLSRTKTFNATTNQPESEAIIYVTNTKGEVFSFKENEYVAGCYQSDSTVFQAQIGEKYTLTIETSGKIYKSSEQELLPIADSSNVYGSHKIIDMYKYVGDEFKLYNLEGGDFVATLNLKNDPYPYYRFYNKILVEYTEISPKDSLYYCWKKYDPNEFFNINNLEYNNSGIYQHNLGFFPLDTDFYGVVLGVEIFKDVYFYTYRYIYVYIVSLKQYHINKDIYEIYKSANKQLEAEQRMFDPIASQVKGNIVCVTNPSEKVFGLFEASSISISTYRIDPVVTSSYYTMKKIAPFDLDSIPDEGKIFLIPPPFWIY